MLILVDAMGGDKAPEEVVNGCIDAVLDSEGFDILLIGDSERIDKIIKERNFSNPRIKVHHASDVIANEDTPTKAIRSKKDSSMVVGFNMLKEKKGDVLISAGNTGALLTGALLLLGRIEGVDRPALAPILPTKKGGTMLIDAGMNTVCKAINYQQFGIIGSIYMKEIFKVENPRVGLINVGTEESKGTDTIKQAHSLLSSSDINFVGNIESRQIPDGDVDVAVCDGFVGNALLKIIEGLGSFIIGGIREIFTKSTVSKIGAMILKKDLKAFFKKLDYEEYGGTPILGVNGIVFKCHGSSNAKAIKNAVIKAGKFAESSVIEQITTRFKGMEVENV